MKINNAACEIRRIPNRSTKCEFVKAAKPMVTAHSANMMGIKAARWNTSEKICATMPT